MAETQSPDEVGFIFATPESDTSGSSKTVGKISARPVKLRFQIARKAVNEVSRIFPGYNA
jgi:hypothetical protein